MRVASERTLLLLASSIGPRLRRRARAARCVCGECAAPPAPADDEDGEDEDEEDDDAADEDGSPPLSEDATMGNSAGAPYGLTSTPVTVHPSRATNAASVLSSAT